MSYNRNTLHWYTENGNAILIKNLTNGHLVNILNWIRRKNEEDSGRYPDELYEFLQEEARYRRFINFFNDLPMPRKDDNGWYVLENKENLINKKS